MAPYLFRWKSRPDIARLEQDNDRLRIELIKLRRDLQTRQTQVGGLKLALQQRHETIDALRGRIEQLQERNQRLEEENERAPVERPLPKVL